MFLRSFLLFFYFFYRFYFYLSRSFVLFCRFYSDVFNLFICDCNLFIYSTCDYFSNDIWLLKSSFSLLLYLFYFYYVSPFSVFWVLCLLFLRDIAYLLRFFGVSSLNLGESGGDYYLSISCTACSLNLICLIFFY